MTDALRLSPPNPSFLDMRNAILLADLQRGMNGGDRAESGTCSRQRGMGYAASTVDTDDVHPLQDFTRPARLGGAPSGSVAGTVRDVNTGRRWPERSWPSPGTTAAWARTCPPAPRAGGTYRIDGVPAPRVWSFLTVARRGRLRPRERPERRGRPRRGRHAQHHAPAQLGAAPPAAQAVRSWTRAGLQCLRLRPRRGDRRQPPARVWSTHGPGRARPRRAQGADPRPARRRSRSAR